MKNTGFKASLFVVILALLSTPVFAADKDVVLGDFNDGTYQGWTIEGNAFGDAPATGPLGKQRKIKGHKTKGLVNTFLTVDKSTGVLTSPEFTVKHHFLTFLHGGGYWKGQTYIELLIQGASVQQIVGRNDGNLKPNIFDLRNYQGKKAQVRIVDRANRGWGHVLADEFILTNTFPEGVRVPISTTITAKGKYLQIPIDNTIVDNLPNAPILKVSLGETLLYSGHGYLADSPDKVDWWSHLAIPEAEESGSDGVLTIDYHASIDSQALDMISTSDEIKTKTPLYDEDNRPQLRFSQRFGWNNDPNGMQYYDGEYHFFFQSNPFGLKWANMFWGHAVSKDLIHWEERPHALRPWASQGKNHPSMSGGMCFSGGGAVDHNNTLGLQKGDTKTMFVTYTAKGGGGERLAYSTDKGRNWVIKEGKLFNHPGRDPKPFWHEPSQHWVIVVYNDQKDRGGKNQSFYTSKDLLKWEYQSAVPGFFECPEFFELAVDGNENNKKWVLMGANGGYLIGSFDGKAFTSDSGPIKTFEEGKKALKRCIDGTGYFPKQEKIYAGQCFSNTPDGRVIYIGWAGMTQKVDRSAPFHHGLTVPLNLTLVSGSDGPRLNAFPISEFNQLRKDKLLSEKGKSLAKAGDIISTKAPQREYDVVVKLSSAQKDATAILRLGETEIPLVGNTEVRVICDRPFMEVVTNNGQSYRLINRKDRGKSYKTISLEQNKGSLKVEEFSVYAMKSIWKKK
jgi:sucrose-6-phosphate hydrolase SacC (GH32 family)